MKQKVKEELRHQLHTYSNSCGICHKAYGFWKDTVDTEECPALAYHAMRKKEEFLGTRVIYESFNNSGLSQQKMDAAIEDLCRLEGDAAVSLELAHFNKSVMPDIIIDYSYNAREASKKLLAADMALRSVSSEIDKLMLTNLSLDGLTNSLKAIKDEIITPAFKRMSAINTESGKEGNEDGRN